MKSIGKHYIWLQKRLDAVMRTVYESDGKYFIRFERGLVEVERASDGKNDIYTADR